jgi:hypothetical protein
MVPLKRNRRDKRLQSDQGRITDQFDPVTLASPHQRQPELKMVSLAF